ncbi:MAG: hypothetical protein QXK12_06540 [Candidatus Nezhaarchaeales archaeon]
MCDIPEGAFKEDYLDLSILHAGDDEAMPNIFCELLLSLVLPLRATKYVYITIC